MRNVRFLLAAALLLTFTSCIEIELSKSGRNFGKVVVTGTYSEDGGSYMSMKLVDSFNSINFAGPFSVYYFQSDTSMVVIKGEQEFVDCMITEVSDNTLNIRLKDGKYQNLVVGVAVYGPSLERVSLTGSGKFADTDGHKSGSSLSYRLSGSGRIIVEDVGCGGFTGKINGSGSISLDGIKCSGFEVSTTGSGDFSADDVNASGNVSLSSTGSGGISIDDINASGDVSIRTTGSGSIKINGKCRNVDAKTTGSGSITGNLQYESISKSKTGSGSVRL